jgi:hypothetical protein
MRIYRGKNSPKILATFAIFKKQARQIITQNRGKFVQSGHPAHEVLIEERF